jgi:hypothetical protein
MSAEVKVKESRTKVKLYADPFFLPVLFSSDQNRGFGLTRTSVAGNFFLSRHIFTL